MNEYRIGGIFPYYISDEIVKLLIQHLDENIFCEERCKYRWEVYEQKIKEFSSQFTEIILIIDSIIDDESISGWRKAFLNGEIIFEWKSKLEFPELPKEVIEQCNFCDNNFKKQKLLAKLTSEEYELLGLEKFK